MKKTYKNICSLLFSIGILIAATGCSSTPGQIESGKEISATGPTVMNARAEPTTVELNRDLQPLKAPEVLADVKDFRSKITKVTLRFTHVPLQIPMTNIGGTTWKAELSPEQIQMLAVSGKSIQYDATVMAQNQNGQATESQNPITITIKSPDLSKNLSG